MKSSAAQRGNLLSDRSGVAALEFVLVAPLMTVMLLGTIEFANIYRAQAKLNVAAGQLAEMIAGQSSLTMASADGPGGSLGDLCTAASYNMLPYDPSKLAAWIESTTVVQSFSGLTTQQDWASDRACPTAVTAGSFTETINLTTIADTPRSLFTQDGMPRGSGGTPVLGYTAISLRLAYTYTNVLPFMRGQTMTFTAVAAVRPRANAAPLCTYPSGSGTAPCPGVY